MGAPPIPSPALPCPALPSPPLPCPALLQDSDDGSSGGSGLPPATDSPTRWLQPPRSGPLFQHQGPLPLHHFVQLVRQQWDLLRLPHRPLAPAELEALAAQAGFAGGLAPDQPPLPAAAAQRFAAWFAAQLAVVQAVGVGVFGCRAALLVAGFDMARAEAEAHLARHPPGTCCLRLGSVQGHLVLSVHAARVGGGAAAAAGGRQAAEGAPIAHYLLSAAQLHMMGLHRVVASVPGCVSLLDLRSGRTHRLSVLRRAAALP